MSNSLRKKQLSPKTIRLRTSFDELVKKNYSFQQKAKPEISKIHFSLGRPYKFPEYQEIADTSFSSSNVGKSPIKKNKFRIEKIQKLQDILLQKNLKFKKVCNTSYKSQKTQRFEKTLIAFEDLQQIESLNIRRLKQQSQEIIRLKEAKKIHELLENKRLSQTIFVRRESIGNKSPRKLRGNLKKSYFEENPYNTPLNCNKKYIAGKSESMIDYLNKTTSYFWPTDEGQRIDAWNVAPEIQIGMC